MKKEYKNNAKVFLSINSNVNTEFEKYCENNYLNKSKIVEGLMKLLMEKPLEINELLKNK